LLIGNEVVRYYRKLSDRFLKVQRAENNTTAQFWPAGTFLRQLPDPISSVFGGVSIVESESQTVTMTAGFADIVVSEKQKRVQILTNASLSTISKDIISVVQQSVDVNSITNINTRVVYKLESPFTITPSSTITSTVSEIVSQIQIIESDITISKGSLELLLIPPPSGVIDGYEESIFITDPINTRLNGPVDLDNDYGVVQRNSNIVYVTNEIFGASVEYIGRYEKTNAGQTIGNFAVLPNDDGFANVSGLTLQDFSFYYPSITLRDFTDRATSSYTLSGDYFNLTNCSIQDPVAISSSSGNISSTINVQNTTYFPSSGYLFTN